MRNELKVRLSDIANGGYALGRAGGKTILVPYALPGEEVLLRLTQERGGVTFAEGLSVLDPSADRILPRCSHFGAGRCRECQWQHIAYPAQLALKADIVADQLYRLGGFADPPIALTRPSPRLWGSQYEAVLYQGAGGKLGFKTNQHTGFPAPAEAVIPLEECHTLTPSLFAFLDLLDLDLPTLTRIILRENEVGEIMVTLSTSDDEPPEIALDLPASVNFLLSDNEPANLLGKTHLRYQLGGLSGRVTAGVSWRANLYQSAALWGFLRSTLPLNGDEHLLDLYAGAGWLSVLFAPHVDHITMVESYPPALTDADENLAAYDHITLIEGDALAVVEDMLGETRCEVALLDPLPAGLGAQMCVALSALAPKRLVYVSENPVSLAQDARVLAKEGKYHLRLVQPFDFEPHTFHAVSVAFFER